MTRRTYNISQQVRVLTLTTRYCRKAGKKGYLSRKDARKASKTFEGVYHIRHHIYRCPDCQLYHLSTTFFYYRIDD